VATNTFEVGDFGLGVENSVSFDLNLRKRTGWVTGSVGGYYSRYSGFIGLFPAGFMVDTDADAIPDTPQFNYRAVDAEFIGAELETTFHLLHPVTEEPKQADTNLHLEFKADAVRARDGSTGGSLPRIPPFHLSSALILERGPFGARLEGIYAAPQDRVAANEFGTDSYFLVNLASQLPAGAGTDDGRFLCQRHEPDQRGRPRAHFDPQGAPAAAGTWDRGRGETLLLMR
jgi:iron complex outermembrane receptor protein